MCVIVLNSFFFLGCNINCTNIFGQTPLMRAALFGDLETVKTLVKAGK